LAAYDSSVLRVNPLKASKTRGSLPMEICGT
jgi:hypothetical protein